MNGVLLAHASGFSWDEFLWVAPIPAIVIAVLVITAKPRQRVDDDDDDEDGDEADPLLVEDTKW
jgi:cytochrome c-type biogenesis protein CcmH/NrfF